MDYSVYFALVDGPEVMPTLGRPGHGLMDVSPHGPHMIDRFDGLSGMARQLLQEATAALQRRDAATTLQRATALRALAPKHPESLRLFAAIARLQGRADDAVALLREAVAARPDDMLVLGNLAHAVAERNLLDEAVDLLRRCVALEPTQPAHALALAQMLERMNDAEAASTVLGELLEREPTSVPARLALARMHFMLGRTDDAVAEYRRVLADAPDTVAAWYGLSNLREPPFDARDVAAIERLHARTDLPDHARASIGFALARAYEASDRYADAWPVLVAANTTWRRRQHWDGARMSQHVRATTTAFETLPSRDDDQRGAGLVFIVGLPRTGSSIVEQILAAHPDVVAGGERLDVPTIIREESERRERDFPGWVAEASDDDWARLGRSYLERVDAQRGGRRVFTDKGLLNWIYLGALRRMLPGARFVDCRRDPLETCLACYRQMFARELGFTYDIEDLARFWHDYDEAMRHWRARHGDAVLEVSHERLTAEPEPQIRRLLEFCALPFDERSLRFHESARSVRTLSADQVREPLRPNTARAHLYGARVDRLRALLATRGD